MKDTWRNILALTLFLYWVPGETLCAKESSMAYDGPKEKLHIYLLIGQSNMAGRAPFIKDESGVVQRAYLLNGEDEWELAKNPSIVIRQSGKSLAFRS